MTRKLETKGYCYIACEVRRITSKAVLVHDGIREAWIPLSQIEDPTSDEIEIGQTNELLLPEWLAKEKDLI
jgi:hypothetical protein